MTWPPSRSRAPLARAAPNRARPSSSPAPIPQVAPKATPTLSTATSGQTEPSGCETEKAWPDPYAQPSPKTSAVANANSLTTAGGPSSRAVPQPHGRQDRVDQRPSHQHNRQPGTPEIVIAHGDHRCHPSPRRPAKRQQSSQHDPFHPANPSPPSHLEEIPDSRRTPIASPCPAARCGWCACSRPREPMAADNVWDGSLADSGVPAMDESVHPTCHNPNTPPAAFPLVNGSVIGLPGQHDKVRRGGYQERSRAACLEPSALPTA